MSAHAVNKIWMQAVDKKQVISLQWPYYEATPSASEQLHELE